MRHNKILSLVLAFVLAVTSIGVVFAENDEARTEKYYADVISTMKDFGLADNLPVDDENNLVTREQFAAGVLNLLNMPAMEAECPLVDISESLYKTSIQTAYKLGLVKGYNNMFRPSDIITIDEAATLLVNALGYQVTGLLPVQQAQKLGLYDGVRYSPNKNLKAGEAARMMFNAGNTKLMNQIYSTEGVSSYVGDRTIFEHYQGIFYGSGVMKGNQFSTLKSSEGIGVNRVQIGSFTGRIYYNSDVLEFLGCQVGYYYKKANDDVYDILRLYLLDSNDILRIQSDDITDYSFSSGTIKISYYDGRKQKAVSFAGNTPVILNGSLTTDYNYTNASLMHCMVGCYTTMQRVKKGHRNLENRLNMCEKMLCHSNIEYDKEEFLKAEKALLFTEFHDVLPGTAIKKAEEDSLRLIEYGDEIVDRLISKSFFKLLRGQRKAKEGEIPVLVYNPHPYEVESDFEVEFQLAEQNHPSNGIYDITVYDENGNKILSQIEKEDSSHGMDWRKKVVFHTKAKPMGISRFDCRLELKKDFVQIKPYTETEDYIALKNEYAEVLISKETGLIEKYNDVIGKGGIKLKAFRDNEDPWGMEVDRFTEELGEFKLLSDSDARAFRGDTESGRPNILVIENGDVRTKVQAIFGYEKSYATVTYTFSKNSKFLDIDVNMLANDANTMFKLCADTSFENARAYVQSMFGTEEIKERDREIAYQKWCGLKEGENNFCILNNGTHGGCFKENEIQISMIRTAVYSAHPVDNVTLAPKDREYDRIDMGDRELSFRLCANAELVDFEAEVFNQRPFVLSYFPSGEGEKPKEILELDNKNIILSALRKTEDGALIRLYNSSSKMQECNLLFDNWEVKIAFAPFEVKTFVKSDGEIKETDMLGRYSGR